MWPINFQYHSHYTLLLCRIRQNGGIFHSCAAVQTFQEAEIHVFRVYGHGSSANKVRVSIS